MSYSINLYQLSLGIFLSLFVVYLSYKFKFLNLSGSVATFILAILVFGFGGMQWAVPILVFFILSSLLSKTGKNKKQKYKTTFEKTGIRDYTQVIANGGIAGVFIIAFVLSGDDLNYKYYLVALASATADTWATEIGILFNTSPRLITTFKKVNPGISGAVSIPGTLASVVGSFVLALSGYIYLKNPADLLLIFLAGFSGSIFDSIIGASIQGQYQCTQCGSYTEKKIHCNEKTTRTSGFSFITNDVVNIVSSLLAILFYYILTVLI